VLARVCWVERNTAACGTSEWRGARGSEGARIALGGHAKSGGNGAENRSSWSQKPAARGNGKCMVSVSQHLVRRATHSTPSSPVAMSKATRPECPSGRNRPIIFLRQSRKVGERLVGAFRGLGSNCAQKQGAGHEDEHWAIAYQCTTSSSAMRALGQLHSSRAARASGNEGTHKSAMCDSRHETADLRNAPKAVLGGRYEP
jgi:hypothetical protein